MEINHQEVQEVPLPEEAGEVCILYCSVCCRETPHQVVTFGFQKAGSGGEIVREEEVVGICLALNHQGPTKTRFKDLQGR